MLSFSSYLNVYAALRLVDNKAILYFEAPSTSDALTWFRGTQSSIISVDCVLTNDLSYQPPYPRFQSVVALTCVRIAGHVIRFLYSLHCLLPRHQSSPKTILSLVLCNQALTPLCIAFPCPSCDPVYPQAAVLVASRCIRIHYSRVSMVYCDKYR